MATNEPSDIYRAFQSSLRPIKAMHHQWRGFLAVSVIMGSIFSYLYVREQGRIDSMQGRIIQLEREIAVCRRDFAHISPERVLQETREDNEQSERIEELEEDVRLIQRRLRRR